MNPIHIGPRLLLALVSILVVATAGCAAPTPVTGIKTARKHGGGVVVQSVRLTQDDQAVRVGGSVTSTFGYFQSPLRHLDVEIISSDGRLIQSVPTRFFPNPIHRSRFGSEHSSFTLALPEVPPAGSTVLVAVHATSIADCRN